MLGFWGWLTSRLFHRTWLVDAASCCHHTVLWLDFSLHRHIHLSCLQIHHAALIQTRWSVGLFVPVMMSSMAPSFPSLTRGDTCLFFSSAIRSIWGSLDGAGAWNDKTGFLKRISEVLTASRRFPLVIDGGVGFMSSAQSVLQRELSETNSAAVQTARNTSGRTVRRVVNKPAATLPDLLQPRSDCVSVNVCVCFTCMQSCCSSSVRLFCLQPHWALRNRGVTFSVTSCLGGDDGASQFRSCCFFLCSFSCSACCRRGKQSIRAYLHLKVRSLQADPGPGVYSKICFWLSARQLSATEVDAGGRYLTL